MFRIHTMREQEFERSFDLRQKRRVENTKRLFMAVVKNDLNELKSLIASGNSVNSRNREGNSLLFHIIENERVEMFNYILGFEELQIEQLDYLGRNALLYAVSEIDNEYFSLQLIHKGANIHLIDQDGSTLLNNINWDCDNLTLGHLVMEKGIDVNVRDSEGRTPLYHACLTGNFDWIYMLLYYGARARIPSNEGVLPIAVLKILTENHAEVVETLFSHTFEGDRIIVNLPTLVEAMVHESLIFPKLMEIISEVAYDLSDLRYLSSSLFRLKNKNFMLFVDKFGNILQEMTENFSFLKILTGFDRSNSIISEVEGVLLTILESNCVDEFVQNIHPLNPTISQLIHMLNTPGRMDLGEEVTKIVFLFLSYGLSVTSDDLDMIYANYGICELFKILLHMDIKMVTGPYRYWSMAMLYYDPSTDLETFFDETPLSLNLLSYYNHPKLKDEFSLSDSIDIDEAIVTKAQSLPTVPSLVELSRNMARKFINKRFQIKNSMQFYTVLRSLPIDEISKKIIALEKKLY